MAMDLYYYDAQVKRYIIQFMEIFNGLMVKTGVRGDGEVYDINVPITYGSKDRVVAAILAKNTQNATVRLPTMSAYVRNMNLAPESRKGVGVERRQSFLPRGGMIPDDIKVVKQLMPVPYKMDVELGIFTSNMDQHWQIFEQILMYFDPILQIQTSDEVFDWTKITTVELQSISFDENYPVGVDRRMIQSTLSFSVPIYIAGPSNLKKEFVKDVFARVSVVDDFSELQELSSVPDSEYTSMITGLPGGEPEGD